MASPRDIVGRMHAAFFSDAWRSAIDFYHDDATFTSYLPEDLFPERGERRGKAEILETFARIHDRYSENSAQILLSVMEGDNLALLLLARGVLRNSGRVVSVHVGEFFAVKGGLITDQRQVFDSLDLAQQVLSREFGLR